MSALREVTGGGGRVWLLDEAADLAEHTRLAARQLRPQLQVTESRRRVIGPNRDGEEGGGGGRAREGGRQLAAEGGMVRDEGVRRQ